MPHDFLTALFLLCFGQSLADYPLQGQFLADGKNRHTARQALLALLLIEPCDDPCGVCVHHYR